MTDAPAQRLDPSPILIRRPGWITIALRQPKNPKRARKRMNKLARFRTDRARPRAGAADRARGRRDRAHAAAHRAGGVRPDRERALPGAAAAEPRRRRGAAGSLHAGAGGNREGRRLDGLVPRPMRGLRHDRGLSRQGRGERDLQYARPASSPGARSPTRCTWCPAATASPRAGISPPARARRAGSAPMSRSSRPTARGD